MKRRARVLILLVASAVCLAADFCGGSGSRGERSVFEASEADVRCQSLGTSPFPPGFDFVPASPGRLVALNFSPSFVVPLDGSGAAPVIALAPPILAIPDDSDGDGVDEGSLAQPDFPLLDGVATGDPALAAAGLGLLTASNYEQVMLFHPSQGTMAWIEVALPPSARPQDFPRIPAWDAPALRTAISTRVCVKPEETLDSSGDDYAAGLPDFVFCDPSWRGSFFANFTSGAAVAADRLFVSMSNLGSGAGGPQTKFFPGAVLVYDLALDTDPPSAAPHASTPVVLTQHFNPTQVTRIALRGREFVLVTLTGAIGIQRDDPGTPEIEGGTTILSDAAIEVIDAETLSLVGVIPLGPAALGSDRLAIDPSGRVAAVGSEAGRLLFAVYLEPLASLPATAPTPIVLSDAVIFDAYAPLRLPARSGGPAPATCPGFTSGVAFNAAGDRVYVSERCDGTLTTVGVLLPADRADSVSPSSFFLVGSEPVTAPLTQETLGELRDPGALRVRPGIPGVDYHGPDLFFLASQPKASLCGIRVESF
ncbi:MAG: hypothetical protein OEM49_02205 [Myxococcales bacterium]|nr:hypothetical protein [Myxococcales bacterium]